MPGLRPFYHRFAWAYDLLIPQSAGPSPSAIAARFARHGLVPGATIVDAGCGTGTYAVTLAVAGYRVTGIDRSAELLAQACAKASEARLEIDWRQADLIEWRPGLPVDGALCRGVLNDLVSDDERADAFRAFFEWLRPGGVLIADCRDWEGSSERYERSPTAEREIETADSRLTFRSQTRLDPADHLLWVRERFEGIWQGEPVIDEFVFTMRCWTSDELVKTAIETGFRAAELDSNQADGRRSDRLVLVATR